MAWSTIVPVHDQNNAVPAQCCCGVSQFNHHIVIANMFQHLAVRVTRFTNESHVRQEHSGRPDLAKDGFGDWRRTRLLKGIMIQSGRVRNGSGCGDLHNGGCGAVSNEVTRCCTWSISLPRVKDCGAIHISSVGERQPSPGTACWFSICERPMPSSGGRHGYPARFNLGP